MTERKCPKCSRVWPHPCEQTICIEMYQECMVCRFSIGGAGTQDELLEISMAASGNPVPAPWEKKCDCHLYETQVCDICQGVDGTEVDATPINYRAHAEALAEASTLAIEYWEHRMQRYKNRHPVWVVEMRAALAAFDQDKGKA